jgi:hypothetical protein
MPAASNRNEQSSAKGPKVAVLNGTVEAVATNGIYEKMHALCIHQHTAAKAGDVTEIHELMLAVASRLVPELGSAIQPFGMHRPPVTTMTS